MRSGPCKSYSNVMNTHQRSRRNTNSNPNNTNQNGNDNYENNPNNTHPRLPTFQRGNFLKKYLSNIGIYY